jgi:hypothetical protein
MAISGWVFFPARPATIAFHGISGVLAGFAALGALLILSRTLRRDDNWRKYSTYSFVTALLAIILMVALTVGAVPDPKTFSFVGPLAPWRGPLWYLVYVVLVAGWLGVLSRHFLTLPSTGGSRK